MNLVLDFGNTRTKMAIINDHKVIADAVFDNLIVSDLEAFIEGKGEILRTMYVGVTNINDEVKEYLKNR